ncbi:MAG: hypothetical protein D4R74_03615 [Betaproteobacteria bacterium]|nr:MAG: hypothetical protein D4R74_03615 [Betaproteobacteria bacterium]
MSKVNICAYTHIQAPCVLGKKTNRQKRMRTLSGYAIDLIGKSDVLVLYGISKIGYPQRFKSR